MKKLIKTILVMFVAAFAVLYIPEVTAVSAASDVSSLPEVKGLKQTGATKDSITMQWNPIEDSSNSSLYYEVYRYDGYGKYTSLFTTKDTTYTVTGVTANHAYYYFIIAKQPSSWGYELSSDSYTRVRMYPAPSKTPTISLSGVKGMARYSWNSNKAMEYYSEFDNQKNINLGPTGGYEFQLQDKDGKTLESKTIKYGSRLPDMQPRMGILTKARVRYYVTIGGKKYYGPWSDYAYSAVCKNIKQKRSKNKKKITVSWKKVSGVAGYRVSVAPNQWGGYKKAKDLSANKTKYVVSKFDKKKLNKNFNYYIKVECLINVNGKKVVSPVFGYVVSPSAIYG